MKLTIFSLENVYWATFAADVNILIVAFQACKAREFLQSFRSLEVKMAVNAWYAADLRVIFTEYMKVNIFFIFELTENDATCFIGQFKITLKQNFMILAAVDKSLAWEAVANA